MRASDLYQLKPALEQNARHCCAAYQEAEPVAIEVFDRDANLPENVFPVVFVEGPDGKGDGTLGFHWWNRGRGLPASRVLVDNSSGFNSGQWPLGKTASHEICETIVSPSANLWLPHPRRGPRIEVARECSDPTQDTYVVRVGGTDWLVSNFVTPFWFMPEYADDRAVKRLEDAEGYGVDWCMRMSRAGEVSRFGYCILREVDEHGAVVRTWTEDDMGELAADSHKLARKQHPASRTHRLGGAQHVR